MQKNENAPEYKKNCNWRHDDVDNKFLYWDSSFILVSLNSLLDTNNKEFS